MWYDYHAVAIRVNVKMVSTRVGMFYASRCCSFSGLSSVFDKKVGDFYKTVTVQHTYYIYLVGEDSHFYKW